MIDGKNFLDQPTKNNLRIYDNIQLVKVTIKQLVVYWIISVSKKYYKLLSIDLSEQQKLNTDSKAIQQINFTGNLE